MNELIPMLTMTKGFSSNKLLKASAVETIFRALTKKTGVAVHPHLLRHTFATLWLKKGGDSLMLQRLLGHTTLMMTSRYCQAVGCYDAIEAHKMRSSVDNSQNKSVAHPCYSDRNV